VSHKTKTTLDKDYELALKMINAYKGYLKSTRGSVDTSLGLSYEYIAYIENIYEISLSIWYAGPKEPKAGKVRIGVKKNME